jgi:hypothetical protein
VASLHTVPVTQYNDAAHLLILTRASLGLVLHGQAGIAVRLWTGIKQTGFCRCVLVGTALVWYHHGGVIGMVCCH